MIKVEKKNLSESRVELKGEVPTEQFMSYRPAALKELGQKVTLKGFRPGQAPEKLLVETIGEGKVLTTMAELAFRQVYPEILKEEKVDALGQPEISLTKLAVDNPLGFTIITAIYPEVKLPDYKKLAGKITANPLVVEEVKAEEVEKIIKELEEQNIANPEVKKEDWPEKIKNNLKLEKEYGAKEKRRLEIMQAITSAMTLDLPSIIIEGELEKMLAEFKHNTAHFGIKFDDYLKHLKKTEADLKADWRDQALERAKFGLIFSEIAKQENLKTMNEIWQLLEGESKKE